jgi:probable HAF family extracellular repeat protein
MMWLNELTSAWSASLLRGLVQGTLLAAVGWAACKLIPRMPASTRYWIWWIICAKFILAAVILATVPVFILPTDSSPQFYRAAAKITIPFTPVKHHGMRVQSVRPEAGAPISPAAIADRAGQAAAGAKAPAPAVISNAIPSLITCLFALWAVVISCTLLGALRRHWRLAAIVRKARTVDTRIANILAARSHDRVRALVSEEIDGVCLFGILSPVILIPSGWSTAASNLEMEMAIEHELTHLRRRDLWLDIAPSVVSTIFFFAPPAAMAAAGCRQAREEACDAAVITGLNCTASEYAGMLVRFASSSAAASGAIGFSPAYKQLRSRLFGLKAAAHSVSIAAKVSAAIVAACIVVAAGPWRLMAREARKLPGAAFNLVRFQIVDLGPISVEDTGPLQINDAGQVIGTSGGRPFLWQNGQMRQLGTAGYPSGRAGGINASGAYVVTAYSGKGRPHSFVSGDSIRFLKGLRRYSYIAAHAINDSDWVAGSAQRSGYEVAGASSMRAVLIKGGRPKDLGTLGGEYSAAYAINSSGQVAGKADVAPEFDGARPTHAFLWQSGTMRDLGTLGGTNSFAYAINNSGTVAGFSLISGDSDRHACVWLTYDNKARPVDLGALPGDSDSEAHGINNAGEIVGTSDSAPNASANRAVVWKSALPIDLNNVVAARGGWILQDAASINNGGSIVGRGTVAGKPHAFLLTPIEQKVRR